MTLNEDIEKAAVALKSGGTILYPTDTIWGIGCDATNADAVQKVYGLKQRSDAKSLLILVDHINMIFDFVKDVPEMALEILDASDKPITIIYPRARGLAANLLAEDGSIGIRVVKDSFCQRLIKKLRCPIVSTSANISGQAPPQCFAEISQELLQGADYVVEYRQDEPPQNIKPSGIIKVGDGGLIKVIRE